MFIIHIIFYFAANLAALLMLNQFVDGFEIIAQPANIISAALILTVLNTYIRPFIKYVLTTFIIITLGLFSLLINAGILIMLDFFSENIIINGLIPLLYSTLIITIANVVIGIFNGILFKKNV